MVYLIRFIQSFYFITLEGTVVLKSITYKQYLLLVLQEQ